SLGILGEHYLSDKEIIEGDQFVLININIVELLKREVDVQPYRFAFFGMGTFVSCFHDPGSPSCNYPKSMSYQLGSNFLRHFIKMVVLGGSCRTKNRYTGSYFG